MLALSFVKCEHVNMLTLAVVPHRAASMSALLSNHNLGCFPATVKANFLLLYCTYWNTLI